MFYLTLDPTRLEGASCNISDYLSCSNANNSSYAKLLGIPVTILGILGFIFLIILSLEKIKYSNHLMFYLSLISLLFMLYLTFAELFVINAVCVICISIAITTLIIFILSLKKYGKESIKLITNHIE